MAKIKKGADGKVTLGKNKSWSQRMGQKAPSASAKSVKTSKGKWAKNSKDAAAKAKKNAGKKWNTEDAYVKSKRIRDNGQAVPKGYMRTGGRYFAKVANMRPIQSKTSQQQRDLFWANKEKFLGPKMDAGWLRSLGNQGMYNGLSSEANFRKTAGARKIIDADGGTYAPDYKKHAGAKKAAKSRYIMAIGQDGHVR